MSGDGLALPVSERAGSWDPRLHVLRAGDEVDTAVLVTARYFVVVDTMSTPHDARAALALVREHAASRAALVINTHSDDDHAWGNQIYAIPDGDLPAPIIGHALGPARLTSAGARALLAQRQREHPRFAGIRLTPPNITFPDSLQIDSGDLTLDLVHTPGHTPDHISAWVPELRLLLAGDAAEYPFPHVPDGASLPVLRASLQRMAALQPAMVIPCHGGTTAPDLLARNAAYFDLVEARARDALEHQRLPGDWQERDDIADLVGLPYATALAAAEADPTTTPAFYERFHRDAVRATLAWLGA
jgi:glyoxylase-like metal-dependent hydrolase (beta-lactamase superfamily II)